MKNKKEEKKQTFIKRFFGGFTSILIIFLFFIVSFTFFTQTKTFRNILKNYAEDFLNSSLNGKFKINELDGTIFTSINLKDISVSNEKDTVFSLSSLNLIINPLQLFFKKIYLKDLEVKGLTINMLEDSSGNWNFEQLFTEAPDTLVSDTSETDTSTVAFPFTFHISNFHIENLNFTRKSFANFLIDSTDLIDSENISIENMEMKAKLDADINNQDFLIDIKKLFFNTNVRNLNYKGLSGKIELTKNYANVEYLYLLTELSSMILSARMDSLNLLGGVNLEDFYEYPVDLHLIADCFDFHDLTSFLPSLTFLQGTVCAEIIADGNFGNLDISLLKANFENTNFEMKGKVKNLHKPEDLFIDTEIYSGYLVYEDVNKLMPDLPIPDYPGLEIKINKMSYFGEPLMFEAGLDCNFNTGGNLAANSFMNLKDSLINFDMSFRSKDINLFPVLGVKSSITGNGSFKGNGFSPYNSESEAYIQLQNSFFDQYNIDSAKLSFSIAEALANLNLSSIIENSSVNLNGNFDFNDSLKSVYDLVASVDDLNLYDFTKDSTLQSNLNMKITANGYNFDIDSMSGYFTTKIFNSFFNDHYINDANAEVVVALGDESRLIDFKSDFMDLGISGQFSLKDAVNILSYQAITTSDIIAYKIKSLNPIEDSLEIVNPDTLAIPDFALKPLSFEFNYNFKDLDLVSILLGSDLLELVGNGSGKVENTDSNFSVKSDLHIDYLLEKTEEEILYLADVQAKVNFSRNILSNSFDDLFGAVSLTGKRLFTGSNLTELESDIIFNESNIYFNFGSKIDTSLSIYINGLMEMTPKVQTVYVDDFNLEYFNSFWINENQIVIRRIGEKLIFENTEITYENAKIGLAGFFDKEGNQDLRIDISEISGKVLNDAFLNLSEYPEMKLNASANIGGSFYNPEFKIFLKADSIFYANSYFGNILSEFEYSNKLISGNSTFINPIVGDTLISFNSKIPIELAFITSEERIVEGQEIDIKLLSENFDFSIFGNGLEYLLEPKGKLNADIKISGDINNLNYFGFINIVDASFKLPDNNMQYLFNSKVELNKDIITILDCNLKNSNDTDFPGNLDFYGDIYLRGFNPERMNFFIEGDLAILNNNSIESELGVYGDLFIGTEDKISLVYENEKYYSTGNILLKNTNLTFLPETGSYRITDDFNYVWIDYGGKKDNEQERFQRIAEEYYSVKNEKSESKLNLDYDFFIRSENDAKVVFILSEVANQQLVAEASGNLLYSKSGEEVRAQGAFEVLPGSKLEFIKTFDATGTITFESDIINPYLDIKAIYQSDYESPPGFRGSTKEVTVQFDMQGNVDDLGTNLIANNNNIAIFVGRREYENGIADRSLDISDAISFILIGKFKSDLTPDDKTAVAAQSNDLVSSTATSFLGSVLSSFVNSAVGDLINNIELSNAGEYTKFRVSGRVNKFKYSFGGTTEVFEKISKANLRIDWFIIQNLLLRFERKEPVVQTTGFEDKINEIGLQYKFEF